MCEGLSRTFINTIFFSLGKFRCQSRSDAEVSLYFFYITQPVCKPGISPYFESFVSAPGMIPAAPPIVWGHLTSGAPLSAKNPSSHQHPLSGLMPHLAPEKVCEKADSRIIAVY